MHTGFFDTLPERCLAVSNGSVEALEEIAVFAEKLGHVVERRSDVLCIKGAIGTAIILGDDPDTLIMCCGFAFLGMMAMNVPEFTEAKKRVNASWVERVKGGTYHKKPLPKPSLSQLDMFSEAAGD